MFSCPGILFSSISIVFSPWILGISLYLSGYPFIAYLYFRSTTTVDVDSEESLLCSKGKDRSVKRRKTTDTENVGEYSESIPSIQRANINERIARLLKTTPKYEDDNVGMEDDNTDIRKNRKRKYQ
jgi:hypothetical protein